jgi:hypothetical protein
MKKKPKSMRLVIGDYGKIEIPKWGAFDG